MKKVFVFGMFTILTFLVSDVMSQSFFSKDWRQSCYKIGGFYEYYALKPMSYQYVGDTNICGYTYQNIKCILNYEFHEFVRNENGKIFWYRGCSNKEILLYDFNLKKNETIDLSSTFCNGEIFKVDSVYNIKLLNDENRKCVVLKNSTGTIKKTWIENIGDIELGFLPIYCDFEGGRPILVCHKEDGQLLWANSNQTYFEKCDLISPDRKDVNAIENNQIVSKVNLFPIPFKNELNIQIDNFEKKCIFKLFDINSKLLFDSNFINQVKFDTQNLREGIYFYEIIVNNSVFSKGMIVK